MQVETIWPGLALPYSQVRAGMPTTELAQKASCVETYGIHMYVHRCISIHVCTPSLVKWFFVDMDLHLGVLPIVQPKINMFLLVCFSSFSRFFGQKSCIFLGPR